MMIYDAVYYSILRGLDSGPAVGDSAAPRVSTASTTGFMEVKCVTVENQHFISAFVTHPVN